MITRESASQMTYLYQLATDPTASEIARFEALLQLGLMIGRMHIALLDTAQNLWDNSGIGAAITTTPNGSAVDNGQYDAGYIRMVQAMYLSNKIWWATPVTLVVNGQTIELGKTPRQIMMMAPIRAGAVTEEPAP
ncbi:MAG: hypothetical protein DYG89_15270 [Caldilinea sp. CFX5]|nr:hypothetical protein [Caldilinea sp. CFX5]